MKSIKLKILITALSFFALTATFAQDSSKNNTTNVTNDTSVTKKNLDAQGSPTGTTVDSTMTQPNGAVADDKAAKKLKKAEKKEAKAEKK